MMCVCVCARVCVCVCVCERLPRLAHCCDTQRVYTPEPTLRKDRPSLPYESTQLEHHTQRLCILSTPYYSRACRSYLPNLFAPTIPPHPLLPFSLSLSLSFNTTRKPVNIRAFPSAVSGLTSVPLRAPPNVPSKPSNTL